MVAHTYEGEEWFGGGGMIYIVGITLFVVCFLLLVSYIDWQKKMDWWEEFEYRRDENDE